MTGETRPEPADGLAGRCVLLGVSGGIAAYKAVELCRRLVDAGSWVVPVLSEEATRFVGRATFDALASEPAHQHVFSDRDPIPHTRLGQRADLVVVAPASAALIGRYANGISSDLLTLTLISTRAPVVLCPAMHAEMWDHPAVQENLATLRRRGVLAVGPATGRLAGGDTGSGRMAEPAEILDALGGILRGSGDPCDLEVVGSGAGGSARSPLAGRRVLVSAGGTREAIDPVRYISNRSSGRQGHALAEEALALGAEVTLVTASSLADSPGVTCVRVESAEEMAEAVWSFSDMADVVILAAAVADFRPKAPSASKLHRHDGLPEVVLEPTPDVLAEVVRRRRAGQVIVGFAAEIGELGDRARRKLHEKGVDILVANDVSEAGVGFEHETNAVLILDRFGGASETGLTTKQAVARSVLERAAEMLETHESPGAARLRYPEAKERI